MQAKHTLGPSPTSLTPISWQFAWKPHLSGGTFYIFVPFNPSIDDHGAQNQKAVSAYFTSKQIVPFAFAEQWSALCKTTQGFPVYYTKDTEKTYLSIFLK